MPLDDPRPEFRELAPWPPGTRFLAGPGSSKINYHLAPTPAPILAPPPGRQSMPSSPSAARAISRRSAGRGMRSGKGVSGPRQVYRAVQEEIGNRQGQRMDRSCDVRELPLDPAAIAQRASEIEIMLLALGWDVLRPTSKSSSGTAASFCHCEDWS
jgi:hypothetical protein